MGGATQSASVDVTFQAEEFFCAEETAVPVAVTAEGSDGVVPSVSESEITFAIPANLYFTTLEQDPYMETSSVTVDVQAPSGTTSDFSTQLNIEATFDGADPQTCGPNALPGASDLAPLSVNVQADAEPNQDDGEDGGAGDGSDGGEEGNGIPLPAWIVPAAALSAALASRRRR